MDSKVSAGLRAAAVLILPALCCALLGCRPHHAPTVAVIPETTAQELWESEHAGAERAAKALGWAVYWNGPSREDDIARQIQIVHNAIARRVTGIVLSPDHAVALITPIRSAMSAGIPVVIVGSPLSLPAQTNLSFVVNDDQAMGRLAAERVGTQVSPGSAVAVLGVYPGIVSQVERARAFERAMQESDPKVRIIERRSTSFGFAEAEQVAEETIRANPDLRAIVGTNIVQTRAAYFAMIATNTLGRIQLVGCDQDLDLVRQLRAGAIDALVAENTSVMGYDAVQLLAAQHGSKTKLVAPVLITREDVDSPEIQQVLDMDWRGQ